MCEFFDNFQHAALSLIADHVRRHSNAFGRVRPFVFTPAFEPHDL